MFRRKKKRQKFRQFFGNSGNGDSKYMLLKVDPAFLKTAVAGDRGVKDLKKNAKKNRGAIFFCVDR